MHSPLGVGVASAGYVSAVARLVQACATFCDQHGALRATRRVLSVAAAAAWLPHSAPRDTRMMRGQDNPSSA